MHAAKPTYDKLIFELSSPGRFAYSLPESDVPDSDPAALLPLTLAGCGGASSAPRQGTLDLDQIFPRLAATCWTP